MRTIFSSFGFAVRSAHSQSKNYLASPIKTMALHVTDTPIRSQSDSDFQIANLAKFCCSGGMGCMRYIDVMFGTETKNKSICTGFTIFTVNSRWASKLQNSDMDEWWFKLTCI